ncbi:DUF4166 domain-containing protein [Permianibacter sp. IMCC34836]|uniref:DUF4166 domain-containing protein n=1 Tax=Permianibacter fluminis TaxID=2738515 RepID=UPI001556C1FD|nr:DUF4166 domain-containing protein [Permianibacter fluminis]NQD37196.1 DUF4166 domain-containing protein [Permianibacter fluminis]
MTDSSLPPSLYQRILAERYAKLPVAVQAMHGPLLQGERCVTGRCQIRGARHPLAWLCARLAGLPRAQDEVPVTVVFRADNHAELWLRRFGPQRMRSRQWQHQSQLMERVGPTRFVFDIETDNAGLQLRLREFFILGVPIAQRWHPIVHAREYDQDGRFHFDVRAELPGIGLLVHYRGYLEHNTVASS